MSIVDLLWKKGDLICCKHGNINHVKNEKYYKYVAKDLNHYKLRVIYPNSFGILISSDVLVSNSEIKYYVIRLLISNDIIELKFHPKYIEEEFVLINAC